MKKNIKIFCTLGPSSMNREIIAKLDNLGIDMFRVNLSHTDIDKLEETISKIRQHTDKPICLDTEGAQIRVGYVKNNDISLIENSIVRIVKRKIVGNSSKISLNPPSSVEQIVPGDLISIDFDSVLLQVIECTHDSVIAKVVSGGTVGSNKAVTVDRLIKLPAISTKDEMAIKIGLKTGIQHFALSFAGSKDDIYHFRKLVGKGARIISKIENKKGIENIDEIIEASDSILIDRGDLSREEPIEKIPFMQKLIIKKANTKNVPVYVATNLLESMIKSKNPTRAEINDIINTLLDGADGLVLAAETAIGLYPLNCVTMVRKTIKQFLNFSGNMSIKKLQKHDSFLLIEPHGGSLVENVADNPNMNEIKKYKILKVDKNILLDAEQIAIGTFSPLKGFMKKEEVESVLKEYRLPSGIIWPIPIVLQMNKREIEGISRGDKVALACKGTNEIYSILNVEQIYKYDLSKFTKETFGTNSIKHPGVKRSMLNGEYFLGGTVELVKRLPSKYKHLEITPKQARAIFETKGWSKIIGFHTRNVIHNVHEYIQIAALESCGCDGVFVHPIVSPKKKGDYAEDIILKTYQLMLDNFYPKGKMFLGAFQTYSRYAGPREAVFTALCRKNFGCSHFIIGRDHTGVANYYKPYDVHALFDRLGDIGVKPIFFKEMHYCVLCNKYVDKCGHANNNILQISGSRGRKILKSQQQPPEWFMRKEISDLILNELKNGEKVFVN